MSDGLELRGFPVTEDVLPNGWLLTTFGNVVADLQSGFACGNHNSEGRGVIHLRPMNISTDGRVVLSDLRFVEADVPNWLQPGDILFNNTNSSELVGKTALASGSNKYAFSNHMTRIRVLPIMEASFVATEMQYLFKHGYFKVHCNNHVSQASISAKYLHDRLPFIVPPLQEQRRIVAKIESAKTHSRNARVMLETIPPMLEHFRQSVLAAAFRGDLTSDWREQHPNVEPAGVLLERIRTERRTLWEEAEVAKIKADGRVTKNESWRTNYPPPRSLAKNDDNDLPQSWEQISFDEVSASALYGPRFGVGEYVPNGVPTVRITDMDHNGNIKRTMLTDAPRVKIPEHQRNHFCLEHCDLLITRTGATIGKCALFNRQLGDAVASAYLIRYRLTVNSVSPQYLLYFLLSPPGQGQLIGGSRAVAQPNINTTSIARISLPLAPLEEQVAIVRRLNEAFARLEALTEIVRHSSSELASLDQSILAKAFRGELVPQDPNDEPASLLLERIRAERNGMQASPKSPARRGRRSTSKT